MERNNHSNARIIKSSFLKIAFFLAYFGMLHNIFVLPIEVLATSNYKSSYFNKSANTSLEANNNSNKEEYPELISSNEKNENSSVSFNADLSEGIIGKTITSEYDVADDNIFMVDVPLLPSKGSVYLEYECYGVENLSSVSKSINLRPSVGGVLVKKSNKWNTNKEEINIDWIKQGHNLIQFNSYDYNKHSYKIRNVKLLFENENKKDQSIIIINNREDYLYKNGNLYIHGYLKKYSDNSRIDINGTSILTNNGEFEGIIPFNSKSSRLEITAYENNKIVEEKNINAIKVSEADISFPYEFIKKTSTFNIVPGKEINVFQLTGTAISLSDSAIPNNLVIGITPLRKIDIPPLGPGLFNVTGLNPGYRYTPDGQRFNKPVRISIKYDTTLIPTGYTVNDIKPLFFNNASKQWEIVEIDSVDFVNCFIVAKTNHFTDYINGIIQTPENPEVSAFAPTMMNDIQAANPAAGINLINPPIVSPTGEANISYPIKIPMGRNNLQPDLTLKYNSDLGSGWLGLGWSINIPSISIDTKWGVPTFGEDKNGDGDNNDAGENIETEIYTLNGEQLMYPPVTLPDGSESNWMPNRHCALKDGSLITHEVNKISEEQAFFTLRNQKNFEKVQRLGDSPTNYYWKVTNSDGTIYWYGKYSEDPSNHYSVLRGSQNRIVYWALVMIEDVFGNNVKYYYDVNTYNDDNSNLDGGEFLYVNRITYSGFDKADGNYTVVFSHTSTPRKDPIVNAKYGRKHIDPFLLSRIMVLYHENFFRSYEFEYNVDPAKFDKTLLMKVSESDAHGETFYSHTFEYYDDIKSGDKDIYFSNETQVQNCNNCFKVNLPLPSVQSPIYNYAFAGNTMGLTVSSLSPANCLCYITVKIDNLLQNGNSIYPAPNTLQLTHFKDGHAANLCPPNIPIQNVPDYYYPYELVFDPAIANPDFVGSYNTFLVDNLSGIFDFNTENLSGVAAASPLSKNTDKRVYHKNKFINSFYSLEDLGDLSLEITTIRDNGPSQNTEDYIKTFTSLDISIPVLIDVITENNSKTFGPYNLSNQDELTLFKDEFNEYYQLFPKAIFETSNNDLNIKISENPLSFTSIVLRNGSNSFTYDFTRCNDPGITSQNQWDYRLINNEDIIAGVKRYINNQEEKTLNIKGIDGITDKILEKEDLNEDTSTGLLGRNYSIVKTGNRSPYGCDPTTSSKAIIDINTTSFPSAASILGSTFGNSKSVSGYLGVGIGKGIRHKKNTFGFQYKHEWNRNEALLSLVDINGDGLSDILVKSDDDIYFKKHLVSREFDEQNNEIITHSFSDPLQISTINNFFLQKGESNSYNFQATFGITGIGGVAAAEWSDNKAETKIFLCDANSDGLIDLAKNGVIYFNHLVEGVPTFSPDSKFSENLLISAPVELVETPPSYNTTTEIVPGNDVVKVWIAPADGAIKINNSISTSDPESEAEITIEKRNNTSLCYNVTFNAPANITPYYEYDLSFEEEYEDTKCDVRTRTKISLFKVGDVYYTIPENLYTTHHDGIQDVDLCPDDNYTVTAILPETDPIIQNPYFTSDYFNFISNTNIDMYALTILNKSGLHVEDGIVKAQNWVTGSFLSDNNYIFHTFKTTCPAGYYTPIDWVYMRPAHYHEIINGIRAKLSIHTAFGNYENIGLYDLTIYPDILRLEADLQDLFPMEPPITVTSIDNKIVQINIPNPDFEFNSIRLETSDINETYDFNYCGEERLYTSDWSRHKNTKEETQFSITKAIADGALLDVMYADTTEKKLVEYKEQYRSYRIVKENKDSDEYLAKVDTITQLSDEFKEQYRLFRDIQQKKAAEEINKIYDGKFKEVLEKKSANKNVERKSLVTLSNICLLYGTILNSANPSVENTISSDCNSRPLNVRCGDTIYFRVHSNENSNPVINWDPRVEYTNPFVRNFTDANGEYYYQSNYSEGFILSARDTSVYTKEGDIKITWDPIYLSKLTDDITFRINESIYSSQDPDLLISESDIFEETLNSGSGNWISSLNKPELIRSFTPDDQQVVKYSFRIESHSNVNWKLINWRPQIEHVKTMDLYGDDGNLEATYKVKELQYPIVDHDIYVRFHDQGSYNTYYLPTFQGSYTATIKPKLTNVFTLSDNGIIYFVLKSNGIKVGENIIYVINGIATNISAITLPNNSTKYEIGFYTDDSQVSEEEISLLQKIADYNLPLAEFSYNSHVYPIYIGQINLYQKHNSYFGSLYRGWGQFMYDPAEATVSIPIEVLPGNFINPSDLHPSETMQGQIESATTQLESAGYDNISLTDLNAFNSFINFDEQYKELSKQPFYFGIPLRQKVENTWIEKWINLQDQCYADRLSSKTEKLNKNFENFSDPGDNDFITIENTGAYAISKYSKGTGNNYTAGLSIEAGPLTNGTTGALSPNGRSESLSEYIDMNSDGYPDLLTENELQLTKKAGGLKTKLAREGTLATFHNDSRGKTASGSMFIAGDPEATPGRVPLFKSCTYNASAGITASQSHGNENTLKLWIDVNGDGLPDLLTKNVDNNYFGTNLNLGNNQLDISELKWGTQEISKGSSEGYGAGGGINLWTGSFEAGVSVGKNGSTPQTFLQDINNDGLADIIQEESDGSLYLRTNLGDKFRDIPVQLNEIVKSKASESVSRSINVGHSFSWITPITFLFFKFPCLNVSGQLADVVNRTKRSFDDFDGDGYTDILIEVNPTTIEVHHSQIRRTNKLRTVINPLGGKFTIDYKVIGKTYDNPQAKWVMSEVIVEDGFGADFLIDGVDNYITDYEYLNGKYDRRERAFFGFETVTSIDYIIIEGKKTDIYRRTETHYLNNSYYLKGLVRETNIYNGSSENMYSRTSSEYVLKPLINRNSEIDVNIALNNNFDVGASEGRSTCAVLLSSTSNLIYELGNTPIVTEIEFTHDSKGRVTHVANNGDINNSNDDYTTDITYFSNSILTGKNIINVPESIIVKTGTETKRKRTASGFDAFGLAKYITEFLELNTAITTLTYNKYGNLEFIEYPENKNLQKYSIKYEYDYNDNKYITKTTDIFGYFSSALYNPLFDAVESITDISNNQTQYRYDKWGRLEKVIGPNEKGTSPDPYTIKFEYLPFYSDIEENVLYQSCMDKTDFTPVAITHHYDIQHTTNSIDTYTFCDGLGRVIQVKKDIEININPDVYGIENSKEYMSVSGWAMYDEYNRAVREFHPLVENSKECSKNLIVNKNYSPYFISKDYDALDRVVKLIDEDQNQTTFEYQVKDQKLFTRTTQSQNETIDVVTEVYKDINGNVVKTVSLADNPIDNVVTLYNYNAIGELLSYTDAAGITTLFTYDLMGRKKSSQNSNSGLTKYTYDKAGNVTSIDSDQYDAISLNYDYNRLISEKYPDVNGNSNIANTTYTYGTLSDGTQAGKVKLQTDGTGSQEFTYGKMGEITHSKRTVQTPMTGSTVLRFDTDFSYDSFNRLLSLTYPDQELINYVYNLGGNVKKVSYNCNGISGFYVSRMDYDVFEEPVYIKYGNGIETVNEFFPTSRKLSSYSVTYKTTTRENLVNSKYTYDFVGNIVGISNTAAAFYQMGGNYNHAYNYNKLNRLISASGISNSPIAPRRVEYSLDMRYTPSGAIKNKTLTHKKDAITETYNNDYFFETGSHKLSTIKNNLNNQVHNFQYDGNGNMTLRSTFKLLLEQYWDEANRLRVVMEPRSMMQHYFYDAAGERIIKANSTVSSVYSNGTLQSTNVTVLGYTIYPSGLVSLDNNRVTTKHYYIGSKRIASRVNASTKESYISNEPANTELIDRQLNDFTYYISKIPTKKVSYNLNNFDQHDEELDSTRAPGNSIFYFHPDHLGTNTIVTNEAARIHQYFVNLPFGETMFEQKAVSTPYFPYLFNGKELDQETGLYYYGARYYDPKLSMWMSVDPMAEKFPWQSPYMAFDANPINKVDPTGMSADWFQNTLTGDVYYNSEMRKGDEGSGEMKGEGWEHMGENGMFSDGSPLTSDISILMGNQQLGDVSMSLNYDKSIANLDAKVTSVAMNGMFKGENANKLMGSLGYNFRPVLFYYHSDITNEYHPDFLGQVTIPQDNGRIEKLLLSRYISNDMVVKNSVILGNYKDPVQDEIRKLGPMYSIREQSWTIRRNVYGSNALGSKVGPTINWLEQNTPWKTYYEDYWRNKTK